jgi:hypothetical protein
MCGMSTENQSIFSLFFGDGRIIFAQNEEYVIYMVKEIREEYKVLDININLTRRSTYVWVERWKFRHGST